MSGRVREITSLTNDTVKAVRALHAKKDRQETGRFLAEGLKFVGEALDLGQTPRQLMVGKEARPHPLLDRARAETLKAGGEVLEVEVRQLAAFQTEIAGLVRSLDAAFSGNLDYWRAGE